MTNTHFIMLIRTIIIIIILIGVLLSIKDNKRSKLPSKPKPEGSKLPSKPKPEVTATVNRSTTDNTISYTMTRTYVAPRRSHRYYRNYPVKNI